MTPSRLGKPAKGTPASLRALITTLLLLWLFSLSAGPVLANGCQFVLGFATLARLVPGVGDCLEDQVFAANGDAQQHTVGGLVVWRKADNWTAFTDGYRTWINGPYGIQKRLNSELFSWEAGATPAQHASYPNLDNDASNWRIYIDPPTKKAQSAIARVSSPSRDGTALQISLGNGNPYTGVQGYYTLAPDPAATAFELSLWYQFSPTTFNNAGQPSRVQAIEFAANKWESGRRWEWALQWENVGDGTSQQGRAPTWRIWTGSAWQDAGVTQQLTAGQWHQLVIRGDVVNGQTHYISFQSDGAPHPLGQTFSPAAIQGDQITVAIQLDGNYVQQPYELVLDSVNLQTFVSSPW